MKSRVFYEVTTDRYYPENALSCSNSAVYVLYSMYAHDLYDDYLSKYNRHPSARWFRRHFRFSTKKEII